MNKISFSKILFVSIVVISVSACSFLNIPAATTALTTQKQVTPTAAVEVRQSDLSTDLFPEEQAFISVYQQVNPSVVHIRVVESKQVNETNLQIPLPESLQDIPQQGIGSGFIYDTQGYIVTNNHVVSGADKIVVTFSDGTETTAQLVGADPSSDVAVVKVGVDNQLLKPADIGDSDALKVGQIVIAIGNPYGLQNSMTTGIISGLGRLLSSSSDTSESTNYSIPDIIQTDTAINPGNSGGPLLNLHGEVVGINTAIESPVGANSGVGYAVPSVILKKIVPALINNGKVEHPWIGISGTTLSSDIADAMKLEEGQRGVLVSEVIIGGPAEKAGLLGSSQEVKIDGITISVGGDIITGIDDQPIKVFDDLLGYIIKYKSVGDEIVLHIIRDGKTMEVSLKLDARPAK